MYSLAWINQFLATWYYSKRDSKRSATVSDLCFLELKVSSSHMQLVQAVHIDIVFLDVGLVGRLGGCDSPVCVCVCE